MRTTSAAVVMDRAALLRAMTALEDIEQSWQSSLSRFTKGDHDGPLYELLEEMTGADVMLRTWSAFISSSIDPGRRHLRSQSAASLLTRMLLQQRKRLLLTIIDSPLDFPSLRELDRHRRLCERWTDVLLSVFPATATVRALRFDPERSRDYTGLWPAAETSSTRTAEPIVVTAMKSALTPLSLVDSPRRGAWTHFSEAIETTLRYDRRTLLTALQGPG
ncbi:hypothetical protein [Caulifigura coniformis]|nr:hypothetical protein [Caulifigura coniformis]